MPDARHSDTATPARELGDHIDVDWPDDSSHGLHVVQNLPGIDDFRHTSELHGRVALREEFLLSAFLWHPLQYGSKGWPYTHFFVGAPNPGLGDDDPLSVITTPEAHDHYTARAEQCPHADLAARYWDFAALTARGENARTVARSAIASLLSASSVLSVEADHETRFKLLLRAMSLAVRKQMRHEVDQVRQHIASEWDGIFQRDPYKASALVYRAAALDKKLAHLDYARIADLYEADARAKNATSRETRGGIGSTYAVAFGIAKVTRDQDRIDRVGRAYVEDLLQLAEERREAGDSGFNVRHWLMEAHETMSTLSNAQDLREHLRLLLPNAAHLMGSELTRTTVTAELNDETLASIHRMRESIVEAREKWPEQAAEILLSFAPTQAEAEAAEGSQLDSLVTRVRVGSGHVTQTAGDDWRHRFADLVDAGIVGLYGDKVLRPVLEELYQADLLNLDILLQPFAERGFSASDAQFLASAASVLASGDVVAATQLWTLIVERVARHAVQVSGGSTTVVHGGSGSDRGAVFDTVIDSLQRQYATADADGESADRLCNLLRCCFSWSGYGWNLRNAVAHGIMSAGQTNILTAWLSYLLTVLIVAPISAKDDNQGQHD